MTNDDITLRAAKEITKLLCGWDSPYEMAGTKAIIQRAIDEATAADREHYRKNYDALMKSYKTVLGREQKLERQLAAQGDAEPVCYAEEWVASGEWKRQGATWPYLVHESRVHDKPNGARHTPLYSAKPQSSAQLARDYGFEPCPVCHGEGIATKPQGDAEFTRGYKAALADHGEQLGVEPFAYVSPPDDHGLYLFVMPDMYDPAKHYDCIPLYVAPPAKPRSCTCHPDDAVHPCAQKYAASECQKPPGERVLPPFREAWAKKEAEGYQYGRDALEQVHFGYQIARAELGDATLDSEEA